MTQEIISGDFNNENVNDFQNQHSFHFIKSSEIHFTNLHIVQSSDANSDFTSTKIKQS